MIHEIDCRGLACPAPVLQTKAALDAAPSDQIRVLVDNEASRQNVTRFLVSRGFAVSSEEKGPDFHVMGTRSGAGEPVREEAGHPSVERGRIAVVVTSDRLGHGDDELGKRLMASFLTTLKEMGNELWRLVFLNNGVRLTVEGSEVLSVIQDLEKEGVVVLVCGTCLTHFDLLQKKQVGQTTNMLDVVTAMQVADKVINV